jgi:DNA helicase-2/ATP-dependent DNA helicase PcrA
MEEQLFPSMMAYDSTRQMEEERRLLYVAITRAEKRCQLSYAKSRFRFGKVEYGMPSRFLKDIDRGYIEGAATKSPFGAPKQSLWGESSAPRFMSSRPAQSSSSSTPRVQGTPRNQSSLSSPSTPRTYTTPKKTIVTANSESPLLGRGRGEAPSPRRLVSANAAGGATQVAQLKPGQLIEHERFGIGEVLRVEGVGENTKAHIRFKNAGEKQLLLKFARFRVLG